MSKINTDKLFLFCILVYIHKAILQTRSPQNMLQKPSTIQTECGHTNTRNQYIQMLARHSNKDLRTTNPSHKLTNATHELHAHELSDHVKWADENRFECVKIQSRLSWNHHVISVPVCALVEKGSRDHFQLNPESSAKECVKIQQEKTHDFREGFNSFRGQKILFAHFTTAPLPDATAPDPLSESDSELEDLSMLNVRRQMMNQIHGDATLQKRTTNNRYFQRLHFLRHCNGRLQSQPFRALHSTFHVPSPAFRFRCRL